MKKVIQALLIVLVSSCGPTIKQVGSVNMISTRNVSMKEDYKLLRTYAGSSKKDLKRNKAASIEEAVNNVVKATPGGEFLLNVKIYLLVKGKSTYFSCDGDVYGFAGGANYRGFSVGDRVHWRDNFVRFQGVILDLKNDRECAVKQDSTGTIRMVKYREMSKIE